MLLLRGSHLSPMYCACQCVFRVGGGLWQGSRERLRVFLARVVQPRGRGSSLEGLRLLENSRASSKEDPERGWHREGMAGVGRSRLEGAQSCFGEEGTQWKSYSRPARFPEAGSGPGEHRDERQTQTTPFSRSSGCDFCSRHANPEGPPPLPPSLSPAGPGLAWPPNEMQSCLGEQGGRKKKKKALFEVLCLWFPLALSPSGVIYW